MAVSSLERRFGQAVRAAREERGFTQEKLAEVADLNRSYLGEIERGQVAPSLTTVEKLAAALGLPPSTLLARSEK
jgi:XRE family transcriptional regulator, regulator of sulfur utilization